MTDNLNKLIEDAWKKYQRYAEYARQDHGSVASGMWRSCPREVYQSIIAERKAEAAEVYAHYQYLVGLKQGREQSK